MDSRERGGTEDGAPRRSDCAVRMELTLGMLDLKGRRKSKAEAGMKGIQREGRMSERERERERNAVR